MTKPKPAWLHKRQPMTLLERFESKYIRCPMSGCWLWTDFVEGGYGRFALPRPALNRSRTAHRISWELYVGPIPAGMLVCHRCDVRSCVNPEHLFIGTWASNMTDMKEKGRATRGSRSGMAKLTEAQVLAIRADPRRQVDIAAEYGVSQARISSIKKRLTWGHV